VILLTAKTLGTDAAVGFRLGADYYIAKPFETQQLLSGIRTLLRDRRDR
jgi:DNA-binding response OmpR family regulator